MATEEYELLPHQLLQDLKYEVEALKKKLMNPDAKANELILEIESMKDSLHELTTIFQKALDQAKDDDATKSITIVKEKLETVVRQNETIAKGMIAISDKLDDWMKRNAASGSMAQAPTVQHSMGSPVMPGVRTAPPLQMEPTAFTAPSTGPSFNDFPPPPPAPGRKRVGLFK